MGCFGDWKGKYKYLKNGHTFHHWWYRERQVRYYCYYLFIFARRNGNNRSINILGDTSGVDSHPLDGQPGTFLRPTTRAFFKRLFPQFTFPFQTSGHWQSLVRPGRGAWTPLGGPEKEAFDAPKSLDWTSRAWWMQCCCHVCL